MEPTIKNDTLSRSQNPEMIPSSWHIPIQKNIQAPPWLQRFHFISMQEFFPRASFVYSDDDGKTITLGTTGSDYSEFLQCLNGKSQVTLHALHMLFIMDFIDLIPLDVLSMRTPKGSLAPSLWGIF